MLVTAATSEYPSLELMVLCSKMSLKWSLGKSIDGIPLYGWLLIIFFSTLILDTDEKKQFLSINF